MDEDTRPPMSETPEAIERVLFDSEDPRLKSEYVKYRPYSDEEGYLVVCAAEDADEVFQTLLVRGLNAVPFGRETWETLTLEAGTPLFETELRGRTPAELGLSRLAGDADASSEDGERLVGLEPEALPERGDSVSLDGEDAGSVTRAADCPTRDAPLSFAVASGVEPGDEVAVGDGVGASVVDLPFVETGQRSRRIPEY